MNVHDLMQSDVVTLAPTDSLGLVDDIMRLARIRHMPVVSPANELVGIVSQRDLFRAAISSVLHMRQTTERGWLSTIAVREVMTAPVFTVEPGTNVRAAVEMMLAKRVGCLPVVEHDQLVGLLSESDCLRYLSGLLDLPQAGIACRSSVLVSDRRGTAECKEPSDENTD